MDRGIEHHHIYNNVVVEPDGSITPKSIIIRADSNTGKPKPHVVPAYHGYDYEQGVPSAMENVQFIALLDAMHSGDDPLAHLHLYKFDDPEQVKDLKDKLRDRVVNDSRKALERIPKLEAEIAELQERLANPESFENRIIQEKEQLENERELVKSKRSSFPSPSVRNKKGNETVKREYEALGDRMKELAKEIKARERSLANHYKAEDLRKEIKDMEDRQDKLREIKDTNRNRRATAKKKLEADPPKVPTPEQQAAYDAYEKAASEYNQLGKDLKAKRNTLSKVGDLQGSINTKKKNIAESKELAALAGDIDDSVNRLWEESNGFFSFDKGNKESDNHSKFRPAMNAEINKAVAQEALDFIQEEGINVEELYAQYRQVNLTHRLLGLTTRLK